MGDKTAARRLAQECKVPVVPGTDTALESAEEAITFAEKVGALARAEGPVWKEKAWPCPPFPSDTLRHSLARFWFLPVFFPGLLPAGLRGGAGLSWAESSARALAVAHSGGLKCPAQGAAPPGLFPTRFLP